MYQVLEARLHVHGLEDGLPFNGIRKQRAGDEIRDLIPVGAHHGLTLALACWSVVLLGYVVLDNVRAICAVLAMVWRP